MRWPTVQVEGAAVSSLRTPTASTHLVATVDQPLPLESRCGVAPAMAESPLVSASASA